MKLEIKVQPSSSKASITINGGEIKVYVNSPAVDGKANAEAIKLLASFLKVKKSSIKIISGKTGRKKFLEIEGITEDKLNQLANVIARSGTTKQS
jgi:hypothetical protein